VLLPQVYSKRLEAHGLAAVSDLGGAIITGIDGNPLAVLAKQLDVPMHSIRPDCPLYYDDDGSVPDAVLDELVGRHHNDVLDKADKIRWALGRGGLRAGAG
jgi:lysine-specific histone demethylase 1